MASPADRVTVACVLKSGGCYTPEYVRRLKAGVDSHLVGHRFVCLSDMDVPNRIPLTEGLPGWWSKLELFRLVGPTLYVDLDTVVTGDLGDIAHYPHRFTMLTDFTRPDRPASGVMAWHGDYSFLLTEYEPGKAYPGHGDQGYIGSRVDADRFQDIFPEQIVSRKVRRTRNPNERLVCFHGEPRPHKVNWKI